MMNRLFILANLIALPGWVLLIGFPEHELTDPIISYIIAILLGTLYAYLVFVRREPNEAAYAKGGFTSFEGVAKLFQKPRSILAGWVHYLAFDLLVGMSLKNDALQNGYSAWMVIPCLLLTLLLGPVGYLLYFILALILY